MDGEAPSAVAEDYLKSVGLLGSRRE